MAAHNPALERLLHISSGASSVDREGLARLLAELARSVDANIAEGADIPRFDPRLEQLRTLVLGREIESLGRLSRQIDDPEQLAGAVSRVLPTAIAQASARDASLGEVLAPALERATQTSIRSDPQTLLNILYPLILPAIRKSIGEGIDGTFQSLNESLKYSLSWRGLKWRWEAWRSGVSFASVVLKHTLVYEVEHAFLIHRHSGLLITHVAAENAASQDPQIIAAMLSAIQDFVRDSFSATGQGLDALRLGELSVWSEAGPFAALVAVIRGKPPESLHEELRDTLSRIHAERGAALQAFGGDSSSFADVDARLRRCVELRQQAPLPSRATRYPWQATAFFVAVLALLGWWAAHWWWNENQWAAYVGRLRQQPGIVVTAAGRQGGQWHVSGLRDPLAADPLQLLHDSSIHPSQVVQHWQFYQSFEPAMVRERMVRSVKPPPGVTLAVAGDHIVAQGSASPGWLQRARGYVRTLPDGAPRVDFSRIEDVSSGTLGELRTAIQAKEIRFGFNESLPAASEDALLDELAGELRQLESLSAALHVTTRVTVTGHSDSTGKGTSNLSLSLARAEAVRALLKKRAVDPDLLAVRGAGPLEPLQEEATDADRSINRRVSLTVAFDE